MMLTSADKISETFVKRPEINPMTNPSPMAIPMAAQNVFLAPLTLFQDVVMT
jgi:hypothetical protein